MSWLILILVASGAGFVLTLLFFTGIAWLSLRRENKKLFMIALAMILTWGSFAQEVGYRVTITRLQPYKVFPYEFLSMNQVDSLINVSTNTSCNYAQLMNKNLLQINTDSLLIYVERKEIRKIKNGEIKFRYRKLK